MKALLLQTFANLFLLIFCFQTNELNTTVGLPFNSILFRDRRKGITTLIINRNSNADDRISTADDSSIKTLDRAVLTIPVLKPTAPMSTLGIAMMMITNPAMKDIFWAFSGVFAANTRWKYACHVIPPSN